MIELLTPGDDEQPPGSNAHNPWANMVVLCRDT
jgi:hypothetical protein